jgi:hypothetical protein
LIGSRVETINVYCTAPPRHSSRLAKMTETVAMVVYPSLKKKNKTRNHAVCGCSLPTCASR